MLALRARTTPLVSKDRPTDPLPVLAEKMGIGHFHRHVFLCMGPDCCPPEVGDAAWQALTDTTWELKLRQVVQFHNGEPFDANAVKFSFARYVDPAIKNGYSTLLKPVTSVTSVPVPSRAVSTSTSSKLGRPMSTPCSTRIVEVDPRAVRPCQAR